MMKKFMMIGLVVFGGVQGIQAMSLFKKQYSKPTREQLGNVTTSFLEMLHDRQSKKAAAQAWEADLKARAAMVNARASISGFGDRKYEKVFMNKEVRSPRSWMPKPETPRMKFKDTLSRQAIHPDIASLFAV